jgi:hypothetical protein
MILARSSRLLLVGTLFSIALTFFLLWRGIDGPSSTIIGLLGLTVSLLFEVVSRIGRAEDRLADATGLGRKLAADEYLFARIGSIVEDFSGVQDSGDSVFKLWARHLLDDCINDLHELAGGRMVLLPLSQFSFIGFRGLDRVENSLKATSCGESEHFWGSVAGERYFTKNVELVQRGVAVTRIFIGNRAELSRLESTISRQQKAGIRVLLALTEQTPEELCEDFLIADDRTMVVAQPTRDGSARRENISIAAQDVRRGVGNFERLLVYTFEYSQLFPVQPPEA